MTIPSIKGSTELPRGDASSADAAVFQSETMPFMQSLESETTSGSASGGTLPIGTKLGHYIIDDYIGGGGMGKVYLATDTALDRKVAVKTLPHRRTNQGNAARFMNEAKSAARLNHENIAQVYFAGEENGLPFIVFEYIEGTNVKELTEKNEGLSLPAALNNTVQVAHALAHAAEHGVVHRDVKPSNILIMKNGKVKLIDMGLARLLDPSEDQHDLTASGVTLGTFDYISPEQARDPRNADIRSDIYSLGCTFFFMLAARPPFPEGTMLQKLLQHQGDAPPDIRSFQPNVPLEIAALIQRMMAKDPVQRFQTPAVLIRSLLTAAKNIGLQTTGKGGIISPMPVSERRKFWQRHTPWITSVALLFCGFIFMTLFSEQTAPLPLPNMQEVTTEPALPPAATITLKPASAEPALVLETAVNTGFAVALSPIKHSTHRAGLGTKYIGYRLQPALLPSVKAAVNPPHGVPYRLSVLDVPRPLLPEPSVRPTAGSHLRRVIDPSGETADAFASLAEALANIDTDKETEFVLRWNGMQKAGEPVVLHNRRCRFTAADGYFPGIEFEPADTPNVRHHLSFLSVFGGKAEFKGIALTLRIQPNISAPYWSLCNITGNAGLQFSQCRLTVINTALPDFAAFHNNAAFFRYVNSEDTAKEPETSVSDGTGSRSAAGGVRIILSNSLLCGEAAVLYNDTPQRTIIQLTDSLAAIAKPLALPADNVHIQVLAERLFLIRPFVKTDTKDTWEAELDKKRASCLILYPAVLDKPLPKYQPSDFIVPLGADERFSVPKLNWLPQ
ncbi:MAG: serine/threonine protein kinase [Planctomycetaceae bacterium]|jgi:serine/threonine-protein kinase|nr:serine/threonine protein kinase [Planctomycetaceae bacterium]